MKWIKIKIRGCKQCPHFHEFWDRERWRTVRLCKLLPDTEILITSKQGVVREYQVHIPIPEDCPLEEATGEEAVKETPLCQSKIIKRM